MRGVAAICIILSCGQAWSQQRRASQGSVSFFAAAPIEDIAAINRSPVVFFDLATGAISGRLAIANFEFKRPLMKTHFNEKYMESEEFPEAIFQGWVKGYKNAGAAQRVMVVGALTIHGKTREVEIPAVLDINGDRIALSAIFVVRLADHAIKPPRMFWRNIAEEVEVKADLTFLLVGN